MIDLQIQLEIAEDYKKRNNLADLDLCMEIVDWFNEIMNSKELEIIQPVHKIIGKTVVDIIQTHSQARNPLWQMFMDNEPLPRLPFLPSVGDLIKVKGMMGVVKGIVGEDIKKYKIHFINGQSITMRERKGK
tara:strand:+ start:1165 stop:1560 length:396 start_codon:yes stop_codon:yes gene_type:complete